MRMKKFLTLGATLALMLGFASCQNEKNQPSPVNGQDVDTYVGVSIQFPKPSLKALPEDYNDVLGDWQGRDKIESIKVYIVTNNAVINSTSFTQAQFSGIGSDGVLTPNLAIEAKSGESVKAYVVINDKNNKVTSELDKLSALEFDSKFKETVAKATSVDEVAKTQAKAGGGFEDLVVMTNTIAPVALSVQPGITEENAKNGTANRIEVQVARIASRAIVTIDDSAKKEIEVKRTISVTDGTGNVTVSDGVVSKVTISSVEYQVTGSALQFNVLEDQTNWMAPDPVYNYTPAADFTWTTPKPAANDIISFQDVYGGWKTVMSQNGNTRENVVKALEAEEHSKFVLPVTHAVGNYKKGNTTMFEIRAKFSVDKVDGEAPVSPDPQTVFLGLSDGKFYSTADRAKSMDPAYDTAAKGAVKDEDAKQDVKEYKDGTMYYYIWLNPDTPYSNTTKKITESPTVRNQVYHAHITGFGEMGLTGKGDLPPDEELETDKTHLSVALKVLPWTMHSYTVNLTNRY